MVSWFHVLKNLLIATHDRVRACGTDFSAQHGSWNRGAPIGARLMITSLKPDGTGGKAEVFAGGGLNEKGRL